MKQSIKELILKALEDEKGDCLERYEISFKRMSPDKLNESFGGMGAKTNQEVWNTLKAHRATVEEAIAEIDSMPAS